MTAFTQEDEHGDRLDWKILSDGGIALYWRREFLDGDIDWCRRQNYQVFSCDCGKWATSEEMYADLQRTLPFPMDIGGNLDALDDSLDDLPVPDVGGIALALTHFDAYASGPGAASRPLGRPEAEIVLDILAGASRTFLLTGRRFLILVQTDDPSVKFDRLGCVSAQWNRREWLNKDRGF